MSIGETDRETVGTLRLAAADNVLVAVRKIAPGTALSDGGTALEAIPSGHKVAAVPIARGAPVVKYGQTIGIATADIAVGAHVHSHNLGMGGHGSDPGFGRDAVALPPPGEARSFHGFRRPSGRVGTRNYIGILTSVNCSGSVARFVAEAAVNQAGFLDKFPHVDGIVPIVHGMGCGMAGRGEGFETLFRTLAGYGHNPNFGAILMLGLGCEVMQIPDLVDRTDLADSDRFRYLTIQGEGGTAATVEAALSELRALAAAADTARREEVSTRHLVLGMQCGGSDGYSGITANPALGIASDLLVRQGGISILSETPEIYGAEHLLTRRAVDEPTGRRIIDLIGWWEDYTARNGGEMDNNPSPGNKRGGLTTILEKSLGAVAKGGSAPLSGVYRYGEPIDAPGLAFMDSPGFDPCSVTGQIASGANLIAFTTGRGSVSGYQPVPGIKLASNSDLWRRMEPDMDVDCGAIVEGVPLEEKGREIFDLMLRVASGERSKSEAQGFGAVEFVPWQIGAVM